VAPTKLNPERQVKPETLAWQAIGMQKIRYLMSKAMFYGGLLNVVVKGAPRYRCGRCVCCPQISVRWCRWSVCFFAPAPLFCVAGTPPHRDGWSSPAAEQNNAAT